MGAEVDDETRNAQINPSKGDTAEMDILGIANILTESDLNLSNDILEEIEIRLKKLFKQINVGGETFTNVNSEEINSLGNENFVHTMTFLEELESLIKLENNGKALNPQLDAILNRIRVKLNEQVKAIIAKRIASKDISKIDRKIGLQDQKSNLAKKEAPLHNKDNLSLIETSPKAADRHKLESSDLDGLKKPTVKVEIDKTLSAKPENVNISQNSKKNTDQSIEIGKKFSETKMDHLTQNFTNTSPIKDLNLESNLVRPLINSMNKLDNISNFEASNSSKTPQSNQDNNDRLLKTLNMLAKSWGNNLIEKIEQSIGDGIEKLEIQLTPKSLGRLNVTINVQDTIAKINIVAESANAAALLGDSESKLSQMMEVSGLRLASLQTQTNQFGGNQKGKEHAHKLASTVKKTNIEDSVKPKENINKIKDPNEGLNLIA